MRSESMIVLIRCAMVMMVRSLNMLLRNVVCSIWSVSMSTAAVASSRTSQSGVFSNHVAIRISATVMQHLPRMLVGVSSALAKEIN